MTPGASSRHGLDGGEQENPSRKKSRDERRREFREQHVRRLKAFRIDLIRRPVIYSSTTSPKSTGVLSTPIESSIGLGGRC